MQDQGDYNKIVQHLQRPINCLADEDRSIRKSGLDTIKKEMNTITKDNMLRIFNQTKIMAMLVKIVNDKIQNNRQVGLEILEILINKAGGEGKNLYQQILPSLISRVNEVPFPEKSQDLRLKVVKILIKLTEYKDCLLKSLPQIGSAAAKCLADAYDQIKYSSCQLISKLSICLPHEIGKYSLNILISLRDNLKHQKFKVRRTSLESISRILVTDSAGGNFQQIRVTIKSVLSDKKQEVRAAAYQCLAHLVLYLGPKYMKEYEPYLIGLLLMGLEDSSAAIVSEVLGLLQKCGGRLRQQQQGSGQMIGQVTNA